MDKYCIGIDNGVTGSVAILAIDKENNLRAASAWPVAVKVETTRTKSRQSETKRIMVTELCDELQGWLEAAPRGSAFYALIERPMLNPRRWHASISAARAFEAVLIALELMEIPYEVIDSRLWQKEFIPDVKGEEKKEAAAQVARKLFKGTGIKNVKHVADSLLIARYLWLHHENPE